MLNRLFSTIKRGFRKIGQGGYTLIEVTAVVAITATLAAVVVPVAMSKIGEGNKAAARQDCQMIAAAIAGFYKDTGEWPAYSLTTKNHFSVLRSGDDGNATLGSGHDPVGSGSTKWGTSGTGVPTDWLENQLVVDNPGGTVNSTRNSNYLDTHKLNWKGPYAETFTKRDPWGNNYLVYVKAMHTASTGDNKAYGWIISAGPDATLNTSEKDNMLQGDDIGFYMHAEETGH